MTIRDTRFPFSELEKAVKVNVYVTDESRGNNIPGTGISNHLPSSLRQTYYRSSRTGYVPEFKADQIAIALGMHPVEIWDNWFDHRFD